MVKRCQSCTKVETIRITRDGVVGKVCVKCQLEAIRQALAKDNKVTLRN